MNKSILSILSLLFVTTIFAQAPQGFNYQAVVRNSNGDAIANANISLRFSLHQTTAGGTLVYQETHSPTTSDLGLANVVIGEGTPLSGTFNTIDWGSDVFFMEVELDPAGGSSYSSLGTQQLMSVPYALRARSSGPGDRLQDADGDTKIQVEESTDEDILRFDIAGNEHFRMDGAQLEVLNSGGSVFVGHAAGANDDLSDNHVIFIGDSSGYSNISGSENTAIGYHSLFSNTVGFNNTAIGANALLLNTIGNQNSAQGSNALFNNTEGNDNTAYGSSALLRNTHGDRNTALGVKAMVLNDTGHYNTGGGYEALNSNSSGDQNTAIGSRALRSNNTGSNNSAIGYYADVIGGDLNNATVIGANAKVATSNSLVLGGTGSNAVNVGIGTTSPTELLHLSGTSGVDGILFPDGTLQTTASVGGAQTLSITGNNLSISTGNSVSVDGSTTNEIQNIDDVLTEGNNANGNIITNIGQIGLGTTSPDAQFLLHVEDSNTGDGIGARMKIESTDGFFAGQVFKNNSREYFVGLQSTSSANDNTNSGFQIFDNTANARRLVIDHTGKVGIGTNAPDQMLTVNGDASKVGSPLWAVFSDQRLKKDIRNFSDGLNIIQQMNTVAFKYNGKAGHKADGKEYVGIIAQEVQEYAPYMIDRTLKKLNEDDAEDTELLMYDGSALLYILVNAVQEQQAIIEAQEAELEAKDKDLEERIKTIEALLNKDQESTEAIEAQR